MEKVVLAALGPRLCTSCLPGITGSGVSSNYTACNELAHSHLSTIHADAVTMVVPS